LAEYSNPQVPHEVNVSRTHALLDFARLLGGIAIVAALALGILMLGADRLAKYLPYSAETAIAGRFESSLPEASDTSQYLQTLADRLIAAQTWPERMTVRVHYVDDDTMNAFATLGGHVVVHRGLLAKLPSENALAMVLSHELAHIKLRHPISTAGRALVFGVAIGVISSAAGGDVVSRVLGSAGLMSALSFSREQERAADAEGLQALVALYGHAAGAQDVFRVLERELERLPAQPPAFLRTHPVDADRVEAIATQARERGWSLNGEQVPLRLPGVAPPAQPGAP
jgi:predicted Zn-dependent protease